MLLKFAYEEFIADSRFKNTNERNIWNYQRKKLYSYSNVVDYDVLGRIANVRVRTNRLYIEHELYTRLKIMIV